MNTTDEIKKMIVVSIASIFVLGATVSILRYPGVRLPPKKLETPVSLGTNQLKVGAKLYNPYANTNHVFTVVELDPAFDFPDDDIRPGVRIKSKVIGVSQWVPRDNLNKYMVVQ